MSYEFPVDTDALMSERFPQFVNLGIPAADLERAREGIKAMWADEPGGWTYELAELADAYARQGQHYLASVAYGLAKFPVLATEARRRAQRRQREEYEKASSGFAVCFQRQILELAGRDATVQVPVHLLWPAGEVSDTAVMLFSGGIDTWKMDLHLLAAGLAAAVPRLTVMAFDLPGTGETEGPLDGGADVVIRGLISTARRIGNGKVAHFGLSFGGNFSAMSGLTGLVDAAVDLGGPVDAAFTPANFRSLMFGMADIAGNAFGFANPPQEPEMLAAAQPFVRRPLLDRPDNAPMLVINGADDVHVPQADTRVFDGRPDTEVHLLPGTGHCAASRLPEVFTIVTTWLSKALTT